MQVTLFVNYSYYSLYDLRSSENIYSEQMCQNMRSLILYAIIYGLVPECVGGSKALVCQYMLNVTAHALGLPSAI